MALLEIENLTVEFQTANGCFRAVDNVTLSVDEGDVLAIVGESGSGKSVAMLAVMGLLPWTAAVTADRLVFDGRDLLSIGAAERRKIIGKEITMIFQEPMSSLNPCFTIGFQLTEALQVHTDMSKAERRTRAIELLHQVGIPAPEGRLSSFPHQLSGGMCQRVMIAMAISCSPKLLIADEPTTALDVTIQAQILDLLVKLQQDHGMALILITHNMGVVSETAQRVTVQYAGQKVEEQAVAGLFSEPHHPYTAALLAALPERATGRLLPSIPGVVPGQFDRPPGCLFSPRCGLATDLCHARAPRTPGAPIRPGPVSLSTGRRARPRPSGQGSLMAMGEIVLEAEALTRHYPVSRGPFRKVAILKALDGASFTLRRRRTLAVVGESGCGKSTLARLVTMIEEPTSGSLRIDGTEIAGVDRQALRRLRPKVQIVFQNPYGSLNPRQKVGAILEEPILVNRTSGPAERREAAEAMMNNVGLRPEHYDRYPHMFSGGQRQRIAIARALMLDPDILVLDEPVSALDVSIQAQVLNLLADLQDKHDLAYLFISHDLSVVRHIADEMMVMYLGKPVEQGPREQIFSAPRHPYTKALLSATPSVDPAKRLERIVLTGELPSPIDPPPGCAFEPRCPLAFERCRHEAPRLQADGATMVACHAVSDPQSAKAAARESSKEAS